MVGQLQKFAQCLFRMFITNGVVCLFICRFEDSSRINFEYVIGILIAVYTYNSGNSSAHLNVLVIQNVLPSEKKMANPLFSAQRNRNNRNNNVI